MTITNVSHIRELNDLEVQAVEMALKPGPLALANNPITITLGDLDGKPFVAIHRKGNQELVIAFKKDHEMSRQEPKPPTPLKPKGKQKR